MTEIDICGVPNSESLVYVYCPRGNPGESDQVAAWDKTSKIATLKVRFDRNARGKVRLSW